MDLIVCEKCGSTDFFKRGGTKVCSFCRSGYMPLRREQESTIALDDDVRRLLEKCRLEPRKAHRYASLVLDIDPTNAEALKYL